MGRKVCPFSFNRCIEEKCKFWGEMDCMFVEQLRDFPRGLRRENRVSRLSKESPEGGEPPENRWNGYDNRKWHLGSNIPIPIATGSKTRR